MCIRDSISSPFAIVDSSTVVFDSVSFTAPCVFKYANSGTYYLQVKHRNALETWSKTGGEAITKGIFASYDFTSAQSQGYGNNLVLTGSYWLFYSGDVNNDGSIDGTDLSEIDNDAFNFESGYRVTDVNGDNTTCLLYTSPWRNIELQRVIHDSLKLDPLSSLKCSLFLIMTGTDFD